MGHAVGSCFSSGAVFCSQVGGERVNPPTPIYRWGSGRAEHQGWSLRCSGMRAPSRPSLCPAPVSLDVWFSSPSSSQVLLGSWLLLLCTPRGCRANLELRSGAGKESCPPGNVRAPQPSPCGDSGEEPRQ